MNTNVQVQKEWKIYDGKRYAEWERYLSKITNGSSKNERILKNKKWEEIPCNTVLIHEKELSIMIQGGVPNILRRFIWLQCSGAIHSLVVNPSYYSNLLQKYSGQKSNATHDIEKDLSRSFPNHPNFKEGFYFNFILYIFLIF